MRSENRGLRTKTVVGSKISYALPVTKMLVAYAYESNQVYL